jgi:ArsR family transcriptional regulator
MNDHKKQNDIKDTVQLFKIFSDYTRLRIIDLLVTGEFCVQDISDQLETSQSAISHQLKLLRDLNVVKTRKQGKQVFYSLKDTHIEELFLIGFSHATEC